jgi:phage terminase small subunit
MATRGVKPKPDHLRLVDGTRNVTRHGKESEVRDRVEKSAKTFGKIECPKYLVGEALWAWKRFIIPAAWLDASREASAIAFCELWATYRSNPEGFQSAKHTQMRSYMSELGLTDERNRKIPDDNKAKDDFWDD